MTYCFYFSSKYFTLRVTYYCYLYSGRQFENLEATDLGPNEKILTNEPIDAPPEEAYKTLVDMAATANGPTAPRIGRGGRVSRGGGSVSRGASSLQTSSRRLHRE